MMKTFVPVYFGRSTMPWVVGTVVPIPEIFASASEVVSALVVILGSGLLFILGGILLVASLITKSLEKASAAPGGISKGDADLTQTLAVTSRDEVGRISSSFNDFVAMLNSISVAIRTSLERLSEVGHGLSASMEQTSSAVYEINSNIESIKARTTEQSGAIKLVSGTMESIAGTMDVLDRRVEELNGSIGNSSAAMEEMIANTGSVTTMVGRAMEEQNVGGKSILESLGRLKTVSEDVEGGPGKLRTASETIIGQTRSLVAITLELSQGMDEMSQGTREINEAIAEVVELSQTNSSNIQSVKGEVERFKTRHEGTCAHP